MVSGSVPASVPAFITEYAVLVSTFGQIPVVALGTPRVHPAAAVGVAGGQEFVGRHVLVCGGLGGAGHHGHCPLGRAVEGGVSYSGV